MMDIFSQAASMIIADQESIIGPLAVEQAQKVRGLKVDWDNHRVTLQGENKTEILEKLVEQYQALFGRTSVEVSKNAIAGIIRQFPPQGLPSLLQ